MIGADSTASIDVPTSFLTLYEDDGEVVVSLGAASPGDLPALAPPCSISLLVREPDAVELRLRIATLALTDHALVPYPTSAPEKRGAWLRVLPIAERIVRELERFALPEELGNDRWLMRCTATADWRSVTPEEATIAFNLPGGRAGDALVLLRGLAEPLRRLIVASASAASDHVDILRDASLYLTPSYPEQSAD